MCNNESDYITVSELRNIHEWRDNKTSYVYFKEKITGQTGRKGKKFEFSWLKTNDLYLEGGESVIQTEDKDYWISAAEVSIRITDDYGKPVLR